MGIEAPAGVKYGIIQTCLLHPGNRLNISWMCKIAGVSHSGYYAWVQNADKREAHEEQDKKDFQTILEAYRHRGYAKGAKSIYMHLLHKGIRMNIKKIRRLMKKFNLVCPIRRGNWYRQVIRAMRSNQTFPNRVNRNFRSPGPRKVLLTDITYLFYGHGKHCYLSTILDAVTHEILAYELSQSFEVDFVLVTVDKLIGEYGCELDDETIIHSDQGCHYTSKAFIAKLKESGFQQSMSRKGNCWDNAPQESFFGHMKDEIITFLKEKETFEEVEALVDDWIDYYNTERYQWSLLKLSPREYHQYLTTGVYPLEEYKKSKNDII